MDFNALATSLGNQFKVIWQAPAPFIACVLITAFIIWRMMEWRYGGTIERLRDERDGLLRKAESAPQRPTPKASSTTLPPLVTEVAKAGTKPAPTERVFLGENITPEFLVEQSRGRTGLQAERANAIYIGKWMRVTGAVFNVSPRSAAKGAIVSFKAGPFQAPRSLIMQFEEDSERLEALHNGDVITVQGAIDTVDHLGVLLRDCEIVSDQKPA